VAMLFRNCIEAAEVLDVDFDSTTVP
jgi:hypothetical protein